MKYEMTICAAVLNVKDTIAQRNRILSEPAHGEKANFCRPFILTNGRDDAWRDVDTVDEESDDIFVCDGVKSNEGSHGK
jgi:hypothetical protein